MNPQKEIPKIEVSKEALAEELHVKKLQLHWLLQITKAINYNFTTKQLLDVYEHVLNSQLKVEKLALLLHDRAWKCALLYGTEKDMNSFDVGKTISELNSLHNLETEKQLWIKTFESILPVHHKDNIIAYALLGGYENSVIPRKNELIAFVQTITNLIVVAIENNHVADEKIRQAGISAELQLAAQMQSQLFPEVLPLTDEYDFCATYLPHQEVGGDYYDFVQLNKDEFAFCMADVSGKGIPAALLASNFQANLHAHINHINSLSDLINLLNRKVFASAKGEKFITFFLGKYNKRTRELQYVNAAHNPPFLIHDKVVYMLNEGSTGLGMFEELPFVNVGKLFIPPNAQLHCYTDGVTDAVNDRGEEFGMDRLRDFLASKVPYQSPKELQQSLVNTLNSFRETSDFTDDITLLSCHFKG
ncbi:MAG: serine/threonine protein phosphatase [Bacteroidetes bacterium]|nr:MAG: serine/threonine protein phosphatase [Bacteroidota bacterium]REK33268.1 MAG: serine/threonine protein phosphatase [Bacteroidota bacterium]REK47105.1 MAG: serine/threonine protein phosphatase [Bacteroidota bacterium]